MKIIAEPKLDFNNVLIRPKRTTLNSRSQVDLEREMTFPHSPLKWKGVPIISANMDTTGTLRVYQILSQYKIITALHKFYNLDDLKGEKLNSDFFMISTGITDNDFKRLSNILDNLEVKWICVDVANGYMQRLVDFCRRIRENYPDKIIVAGNICTREMAEELIINGKVDVCKAGIGGGSGCLTRSQTGVGMPQLSCIMECADACHGVNGYVISDGGITCPGDMAKAFGGGADFVMMGGQFAGHDENPGEVMEENGQKYKLFYGMSSELAMKKHYGKMEKHRSSEGRVIKIKYKGSLEETVLNYLGGLRSTCTYINAKKIKHISKCTTFIMVSQQLNNSLIK